MLAAALIVAIAFSLTACTLARNTFCASELAFESQSLAPLERPADFEAGSARIDVTPPPGFPTGGHGPAGAVAHGWFTRLYARAFFFRDCEGTPLALVSVDSFAVSAALREEVLRRVNAAKVYLPRASLILAATHTHQGPGNYLSGWVYNQYGSAVDGFSHPLYDFLAGQIAAAVVEAAHKADQSTHVELRIHTGRMSGRLFRNRSPRTFNRNWDRRQILDSLDSFPGSGCPEVPDRLEAADEESRDWDLPGCPRLRAVDSAISALEVRIGGRRQGALLFFAAHPTVLYHEAPLYSSDFVGAALREIETGDGIVAGFFNGAEGDIVPRRTTRDLKDVMTLGRLLRQEIDPVLNSPQFVVLTDPTIKLRSADARAGETLAGTDHAYLAPRPKFGAAGIGGGEGDRTLLYGLGWREGKRDVVASSKQGTKLGALDSKLLPDFAFTNLFAPPSHFPQTLPLSFVSIESPSGSLHLAAVPVELSTAEGYRLRNRLGFDHGRLEIIGLANDYASYCTTPEEYAAQDYMGASTLFGPYEGNFLVARLLKLFDEPSSATGLSPASFRPGPSPAYPFGPEFLGDPRDLPDEDLDRILVDDVGLPERHLPFFEWDEVSAMPVVDGCYPVEAPAGGNISDFRASERSISVLREDGRVVDDDQGMDFLVVLLSADPNTHRRRFAAVWLTPLWPERNVLYRSGGRYRFVVKGPALACGGARSVQEMTSRPFTVDLTVSTKPAAVAAESGCGAGSRH